MTASISTKPTYAVPNKPASVIFQAGNGATNFLRVWATTAPEGTKLRAAIDANKLNRSLIYQGPGGTGYPLRITFEKGGAYSLIIQEYTRGNDWGGGYDGDPRGAPSETLVDAEQTHTLYVAQRLRQTLGVTPDTADLVVFVVNTTIRPTVAAVHGEATPVVTGATTDKARSAASEADLLTAASNLSNQLVANTLPVFGAGTNVWIDSFLAHSANTGGTWHQNADTTNADLVEFKLGSYSLDGVAKAVNELRKRYALHIRNASITDPTPGSDDHHAHNSLVFDLPHDLLPITADAADPTTITAAMADFLRAYELHRVALMHETSDNTNSIATTSAIMTAHRAFLEALTEQVSVAIPGQTTGAMSLVEIGFEET